MAGNKIIINASNIKFGGGLQVAVSVVSSLINNPRALNIRFVVSQHVFEQLILNCVNVENVIVISLEPSNVISMLSGVAKFRNVERDFNPDLIFTIFGPGYYHSTNALNLIGFANAWLVQPHSRAYSIFTFKDKLLKKIKNKFLAKLLYKKDCYYVTESKAIADDFCVYFKTNLNQISVVNNCLSHYFVQDYQHNPFDYLRNDERFKFVTVSHNYPHKNLKVISSVGERLESLGFNFTFVVTFPYAEYETMGEAFKKYTTNVGVVSVSDCPKLYDYCDALFLPTLIECFSVSYLEAMFKNIPIATSDFGFSREVCPIGTFYFDPYNYMSICNAVEKLLVESTMQCNKDRLNFSSEQNVLSRFGNNETRVDKYVDLINQLILR